jgi:hypothetical protein
MGIRFSISQKSIIHSIQSSRHPSLKIENCREYLEPEAGLSGSMRNSNLIHSDLSVSGPSTLSIFFTLETKGKEGGCSRAQKDAKHQRFWETYSWPLSGLKFFNRSVITVLYVERKIAIFLIYFRLFLELDLLCQTGM